MPEFLYAPLATEQVLILTGSSEEGIYSLGLPISSRAGCSSGTEYSR